MEQSVTGGSGIHCPNSESQSCIGVYPFQCGQKASLLPHMTIEIKYDQIFNTSLVPKHLLQGYYKG